MPMTTDLPSASGCNLLEAGRQWDAVRVPRKRGLSAMALLGARCGAVLEHPAGHVVYFFVHRGASSRWMVEGTQALSEGTTLAIPPARRTQAPGPRWLVCPGDSDWLTDAAALQAALEDCGPSESEAESA